MTRPPIATITRAKPASMTRPPAVTTIRPSLGPSTAPLSPAPTPAPNDQGMRVRPACSALKPSPSCRYSVSVSIAPIMAAKNSSAVARPSL